MKINFHVPLYFLSTCVCSTYYVHTSFVHIVDVDVQGRKSTKTCNVIIRRASTNSLLINYIHMDKFANPLLVPFSLSVSLALTLRLPFSVETSCSFFLSSFSPFTATTTENVFSQCDFCVLEVCISSVPSELLILWVLSA